jgi:subtilisin family serine protease
MKYFKPLDRQRAIPPLKHIGYILPLIVFTTLLYTIHSAQYLNEISKADPALYQFAMEGKGAYATVVYRDYLPASYEILREWKFGDIRIAYIYASGEDLKSILESENLIYAYSWSEYSPLETKITLPPYKIGASSGYYTYDLSYDAKRRWHGANQLWTGKGVTVAIIDTGIDYTHPDFFYNGKSVIRALVSALYLNSTGGLYYVETEGYTPEQMKSLAQWDLSVTRNLPNKVYLDANGHGTHVAGIIAGQGNAKPLYAGIASGARIVMIKAFTDEGYATEETILNALQWLYDNAEKYNIKVLSCSFGSAPQSAKPSPTDIAFQKLIEDRKIFVFAAAGNAYALPGTVLSPAKGGAVFAVGAIDPYSGKLAVFSSVGDPYPPVVPSEWIKPDFVGAGVNVISARSQFMSEGSGYYILMSGTSMACPSVAAVFACFYEYFIETKNRPPTAEDFVLFTRNYGVVYNPLWKDFITGYGSPKVPVPQSG